LNPFSVARKVDKAFSVLFQHCCNGQAFAKIDLLLTRPSAVASTPAKLFLQYTFKLIAVATVSWAHNDVTPTETLTFNYGDLQIRYAQQNADGTMASPVAQRVTRRGAEGL
jgi:type VI protein secretion system component Hcp